MFERPPLSLPPGLQEPSHSPQRMAVTQYTRLAEQEGIATPYDFAETVAVLACFALVQG